MEKREIKASLNESMFTNLCKNGFIRYQSTLSGTYDVSFTRIDIKQLCEGEILEKQTDDALIKLTLQDFGLELIREIVKRSPIYSDIAQEI
jgi:hypothetical protein